MKMDEFMTALQSKIDTLQPNYPNNAGIKADFEELYRRMDCKPLKEIDEVIYAVCILCRDHEKSGFVAGIKIGLYLICETRS